MQDHVNWLPPSHGYVQCNSDVAIFSAQNRVGMGACVRDSAGCLTPAYSMWIPSTMTTVEGEAWGLLQSLNWLVSMNLEFIELERKQVVTDIYNVKTDLSEYGSLL